MAGEIYIARQDTLQEIGRQVGVGITHTNNFLTTTSDGANTVFNITGKCQLVSIANYTTNEVDAIVQIDGATNRIRLPIPPGTVSDLSGLRIIGATSLKVTAAVNIYAMYRVLP
jgi:hypothetical protein